MSPFLVFLVFINELIFGQVTYLVRTNGTDNSFCGTSNYCLSLRQALINIKEAYALSSIQEFTINVYGAGSSLVPDCPSPIYNKTTFLAERIYTINFIEGYVNALIDWLPLPCVGKLKNVFEYTYIHQNKKNI